MFVATLEEVGFQERIQTGGDDDVTVCVAVLTLDESRLAFGTDLAKEGIQPVWLEIDNHMDGVLYPSTLAEPRMNLTGDPWFTDGLVLFISSEPVPPNKIRVVDWVLPQGDVGEGMEELIDPVAP